MDHCLEIVRKSIAVCDSRVDSLDKSQSCYLESVGLIEPDPDFVGKHMIHKFGILEV
jgi:hypothetical protein